MYFMLDGLYCSVKVIFVPKYVSRVVFKGDILGSVRQFWGNPYLNSMTALCDKMVVSYSCIVQVTLFSYKSMLVTK